MVECKQASPSLPELNTCPRFDAHCALQTLIHTALSPKQSHCDAFLRAGPWCYVHCGTRGTHHRVHTPTMHRLTHRGCVQANYNAASLPCDVWRTWVQGWPCGRHQQQTGNPFCPRGSDNFCVHFSGQLRKAHKNEGALGRR